MEGMKQIAVGTELKERAEICSSVCFCFCSSVFLCPAYIMRALKTTHIISCSHVLSQSPGLTGGFKAQMDFWVKKENKIVQTKIKKWGVFFFRINWRNSWLTNELECFHPIKKNISLHNLPDIPLMVDVCSVVNTLLMELKTFPHLFVKNIKAYKSSPRKMFIQIEMTVLGESCCCDFL